MIFFFFIVYKLITFFFKFISYSCPRHGNLLITAKLGKRSRKTYCKKKVERSVTVINKNTNMNECRRVAV